MPIIRRLSTQSAQFDTELRQLLAYESSQDDAIEHACKEILQGIQQHGDTALLDYTHRFDHLQAGSVAELEITRDELQAALNSLPSEQRSALEAAAGRIRLYHERQRTADWSYTEADGTVLGQRSRHSIGWVCMYLVARLPTPRRS